MFPFLFGPMRRRGRTSSSWFAIRQSIALPMLRLSLRPLAKRQPLNRKMVHVEVRTSPTKKTLLPCLFGYLIFSVNSFPPCSPQRVGGIRPKTLCGRISPRFVADGGRFPPKDVADPPRRVAEGWGVLKKNTPHLFTWDTSSPPRGEKKSLNRSFFGLCLFAFALTLHLHVPNAVAVTKQEVLKKY